MHDEAGAQGRHDDLLDALGEVRRVQERRLGRVGVAVAFRAADQVAAQQRARQRRPGDAAPGVAEVLLQPRRGSTARSGRCLRGRTGRRARRGLRAAGGHGCASSTASPAATRERASAGQRPDGLADRGDPDARLGLRVDDQRAHRPRAGRRSVEQALVGGQQPLRGTRRRPAATDFAAASRHGSRGQRPGQGGRRAPGDGTGSRGPGRGANRYIAGGPRRVEPARDLARDGGPGIPVGQDHVAAGQRRAGPRRPSARAASAPPGAPPRAGVSDLASAGRPGRPGHEPRRPPRHQVDVRRPLRSSQRAERRRGPADLPDPSRPSAAIR